MRWLANRSQGRRAVGGALFLTNARLVFHPHRFDQLTGGKSRDLAFVDIDVVDVEPATGSLFDGGLRDRLRVQPRDGETELFVVDSLTRVLETVHAQLST